LNHDAAPLFVSLQLTPAQRALIRQQTGVDVTALPVESRADFVRCTFGGLTLRVKRGVFAPTATTERLFDLVREGASSHRHPVIVDVGTGCGALALATSATFPNATVLATEISDVALACARRNRTRLGLPNVTVLGGSLLSPLPRRLRGTVAVIAANIPYVPPSMADIVKTAFPVGTAVGTGADGLDLVRELARGARDFLVDGGALVLQMAGFQLSAFADELRALGYQVPTSNVPVPNGAAVVWVRWPGTRS
jgi:release factor glutamine methyltransferase